MMWVVLAVSIAVALVTVLALAVLFDPVSFMDEDEREEFHRGGGM